MPDIDIDFVNRDDVLSLFEHIPASRIDNSKLVKHNTGVYLHEVPVYAPKNLCAVTYNEAEEYGYFKLDFLNVSMYKGIRDEEHLVELMNREPLWDLLEQEEVVNLLFHINGHASILQTMKPKSIEELAAVLAIIRPAKRYLLGKSWQEVFSEVWSKPTADEYYFKKSHATAYAVAIVVQLNLICEGLTNEFL